MVLIIGHQLETNKETETEAIKFWKKGLRNYCLSCSTRSNYLTKRRQFITPDDQDLMSNYIINKPKIAGNHQIKNIIIKYIANSIGVRLSNKTKKIKNST